MAQSRHLPLAAAVSAVLAFAVSASAQPIDSFDIGSDPAADEYSLGPLAGQSPSIIGWTGPWEQQCCGSPDVVETGLSFSTVPVSGGGVEFTATTPDGRVGRDLANPVTGDTNRTLYLSFMMQVVDAVAGDQITYGGFELHNANGLNDGDRQFQIVVGENIDGASQTPNYSAVLFNSDDPQFAMDLGPNNGEVNFFVTKFELSDQNDMDSVSVWRNPTDLSVEENNTPDFTSSGFNININSTTFGRFGAAGTFQFDELRQGSTFESVTSAVPDFLAGDTDGNFIVDIEDFYPIRDNWLETNNTMPGLDRMDGDLNLDGSIDIVDFREWKNEFTGPPAQIAEAFASLGNAKVPEPASVALAVVACAGVLASRRYCRR